MLDAITEAQQAIIGSMLIDESCIGAVLLKVTADDFSGPYQRVFKAIREIYTQRKAVDAVTVSHMVESEPGYTDFVAQIVESTPTAAHAESYCDVLREQVRLRRLQDLGSALTMASSLDEAQKTAESVTAALAQRTEGRVVSAGKIAERFFSRMRAEKKPEYLRTGIKEIDDLTYLERGDLAVIGAEPSTGKTAFALQWALDAAKTQRVGFYSLETSPDKLSDRIMASLADVELGDIKQRTMSDDAWARLAAAATQLASRDLEIIPAAGMTAAEIVSTAIARRHTLIFVDYVQLCRPMDGDEDRFRTVTRSSIEFHTGAQRAGITVVLLSQLSRPEKTTGARKPPSMHSLRESGQLEQDADLILLLYLAKPDDYTSDRVCKVAKNKEGRKGAVTMIFDGAHQRFSVAPKNAYAEIQKIARQARREGSRNVIAGQADFAAIAEPDPGLPF